VVVFYAEVGGLDTLVGVESVGTVDEAVLTIFVHLEGLATDLLFTVDEAVVDTVVVEVDLSVTVVYLDKFLPVHVFVTGLVVLNKFKLIGEPPSKHEFVPPVFIVTSYLPYQQSLIVLIQGDSLDNSIDLKALSIKVHLALFIKDSLLPIGTQI
jgi:hypothetical protein